MVHALHVSVQIIECCEAFFPLALRLRTLVGFLVFQLVLPVVFVSIHKLRQHVDRTHFLSDGQVGTTPQIVQGGKTFFRFTVLVGLTCD